MSQKSEEKQGFLGDLNDKSKNELIELLERQEKLLKNRMFLNTLPDKGVKIQSLARQLTSLIASREKLDAALLMMEGMSLRDNDEEMADAATLQLDGKDISIIARTNKTKPARSTFHPNRCLRSDLRSLAEVNVEETPEAGAASPQSKHRPATNNDSHTNIVSLLNFAQTASSKQIESYVSHCRSLTPDAQQYTHVTLDQAMTYCFVAYHLIINRPGETGEICQLVAAASDSKPFSEYCLPSYISTNTSRDHGLKIQYRQRLRILTKDGVDVQAQPTQIVLKNFNRFLEEQEKNGQIVLLNIGQTNTLLFNYKYHNVPAPNVLYSNCPHTVLGTLPKVVPAERIVHSLCQLLRRSLLDTMNVCEVFDLAISQALLERTLVSMQKVNSMRGKLFDFSMKEREVISPALVKAVAENGLSYQDLCDLYCVSEEALVTVLVRGLPPTNQRITDRPEHIEKLLQHFRNKNGLHKFDAALLEGGHPSATKLVSIVESLELLQAQNSRLQKIQLDQAKEKLKFGPKIQMVAFDSDATAIDLKYREPSRGESSDSDEDDSEVEQDYPE